MHRSMLSLGCLVVLLGGLLEGSLPSLGAQDNAPPEGDLAGRCRLVLPPEIPAVVGHEMNFYFDNVVLVPNVANWLFDVTCAKGQQQAERWTYTPAAGEVGEYPLRLDVYDADNRLAARGTTTVRVLPATAGRDQAVTALLIGDSLTHASCYSEELLKLCAAEGPPLTLRGTHHIEGFSAANVHEGYGGWTFRAFVSQYEPNPEPGSYSQRSSPFVFLEDGQPTFDFPRYVREHCEGQPPDFVTIALGCNDTFGANEDHLEETIDQMFGCADQLLAGIRQAGPEIAIGLFLLVPPAASQDNFGANYACGQTRWQYRRNQHRVVERMLATYGGREQENLFLIPAYVNLDTVHNFPTATGPANARSDFPITRGVNGVHPAPAGYYQMADTLYAWLKGRL